MIKPETKFKQLVRKKLGVKRVTKEAQQKVWAMLNQKNKNMYGGWEPVATYYSNAPMVTLEPTNVCVLGEGAYGKVCVRKTPSGKKYAVKTPIETSGNNFQKLMSEKREHMRFYYRLPMALRKYFPKPVNIKGEPNSYAMTMFDGVTLHEALKGFRPAEYKRNVIKNLRKAVFAIWTSGYIHGDMHMGNIMVSRDAYNPQIQILDFGFMRKSNLNVPNNKFKINGNVGYKNLTDKWVKWFKNSWTKQLNNLGIKKGNPNMIVFPQRMGNLGYYAEAHSGGYFRNLNKDGNNSRPKMTKERLEKYKELVRKRMGVKRVTKQAQIALWNKLSNTNKKQFGTWKPEGAVKHRTSPPKAKGPTPTLDQQVARDFLKVSGHLSITDAKLLRFWMTHYTTAQKKALYKKVRDPEYAKNLYPLCK